MRKLPGNSSRNYPRKLLWQIITIKSNKTAASEFRNCSLVESEYAEQHELNRVDLKQVQIQANHSNPISQTKEFLDCSVFCGTTQSLPSSIAAWKIPNFPSYSFLKSKHKVPWNSIRKSMHDLAQLIAFSYHTGRACAPICVAPRSVRRPT